MTRRSVLAALLCCLPLAACGGSEGVDDRLVAASGDDEFAPEGCGRAGAADDLDAEPSDWLDEHDYVRWEDVDGCPVRIDVLGHLHGDVACGWESVEFITIGWPVGTSYALDAIPHRYYWDPDGLLGEIAPATGTIPRAELPATAIDTSYRLDGLELFVDPIDENVVYRVAGDEVEVWPRDIDGTIGCDAAVTSDADDTDAVTG